MIDAIKSEQEGTAMQFSRASHFGLQHPLSVRQSLSCRFAIRRPPRTAAECWAVLGGDGRQQQPFHFTPETLNGSTKDQHRNKE
jgi:hypothetical protein